MLSSDSRCRLEHPPSCSRYSCLCWQPDLIDTAIGTARWRTVFRIPKWVRQQQNSIQQDSCVSRCPCCIVRFDIRPALPVHFDNQPVRMVWHRSWLSHLCLLSRMDQAGHSPMVEPRRRVQSSRASVPNSTNLYRSRRSYNPLLLQAESNSK